MWVDDKSVDDGYVVANFFPLNLSFALFLWTLPYISIHKHKGKLNLTGNKY